MCTVHSLFLADLVDTCIRLMIASDLVMTAAAGNTTKPPTLDPDADIDSVTNSVRFSP